MKILGIDEVGYGCWAGDLVVCGVISENNWSINGLNDSKKLSKSKREKLNNLLQIEVRNKNISHFMVRKSSNDIDKYGLGVCHKQAYAEVIKELSTNDCEIILDGNLKINGFDDKNIKSVIKADSKYSQVMAASILAKVFRDNLMIDLSKQYPNYHWDSNVGYINKEHIDAVNKFGYSPYHRQSYNVKDCLINKSSTQLVLI